MNIVYYNGEDKNVCPELVEGGPGWYVVDNDWNVHGFDTKQEAKDAVKEMDESLTWTDN